MSEVWFKKNCGCRPWLLVGPYKERERIKKASLDDEKVLLWMAKKARSKQKRAM